ncbi:MAG: GntR family transcriptional regulator [Streptosporangiaceae bacterium]|nr:GntR family transcriptional regulator [Streptosporangiaceae bacterium]
MAADPMYRQIAEDLRRQIEEGSLAPGQQLRTELELRERYQASRNTVRDAVKWLIGRGLVETRPGQGTFVVEKIIPFVTTLTGDARTGFGGGEDEIYDLYDREVKAERREPEASEPRVEMQRASGRIANELRVEENSAVVSRHQQRLIDGTPWSLQTSFYPMSFVENGALRLIQATDIPQGTVAYLAETLQIQQAGWRDMITVRTPDKTETDFFGLPDDGRVSVIETRRTAFDERGTPVRLTVSVYPADRNQFAVNVGRVPADVADPTSAGTNSDVTTRA